MPKRTARQPESSLKTVVLVDVKLATTNLGNTILTKLQDAYAESGNVKVCTRQLNIPYSIQWIVPKRNMEGDVIHNSWKVVAHTLVFESIINFSEKLKKSSSHRELINELFGPNSEDLFENRKIRLLVHEENMVSAGKTARTTLSPEEKNLLLEVKRMENDRNFEKIVGFEISYGIDIVRLGPPKGGISECAVQVIRSTKSVFDCLASTSAPSVYSSLDGRITWYPSAKKIGPTVAVSKNDSHLGLHLLWQKHLMQISKGINIEQAKVITAHSNFSSPATTIQTFVEAGSDKEGEKLLTGIQVRPTASSKDFMSLGARSNVGADTSKKVFRMMTATDGNTII